ncbi:MAG TPA: sodium/proton-translocating pyrophosphatase, partial [Streptosporangiaceae bacterium]|nr:sodium/proton-translocating pyrophosphatase [Streptosporangiaceae bacterium]
AGAVFIGIVLASAIQLLTGYFTETNRRPVIDIGKSSETGAATVILAGISIGMESAVYSALLIGGAVFGSSLLATGNATIALFAVAMAGIGLLTTVGVIVSMDSFGPVTDNAQGIAEMSGDVDGAAAQALTTLDAIGNTTKAITKGIAIATEVLAATALFGSFRTRSRRRRHGLASPATAPRRAAGCIRSWRSLLRALGRQHSDCGEVTSQLQESSLKAPQQPARH